MNAQGRIRSTIVKVPDANPGLLFLNGQQRQFTLEGVWKSPVAPAANMTVDVEVDGGGQITGITAVDSQQLAKERMNQLSGVAQEKGKEAAKLAQQGVGALAARMGKVALGATVVVWIAWFFLPSATLGGGITAAENLTFWNLLGIDFNSPLAVLGGGADHGFLAYLGIACISAPFAAPFITAPWAKYLNAAPLGIFVVGFISVYMSENKAFGDLAKLGAPSPFSWSWGIFVLGLAALVLASGALKKPAA
ncbi:MAG TPA: hypothetical protein VFO34_02215 [Candidatus Acidoferrales bacterium]|nr:hypothetical protein [Candidatus Acidoferrales bacterium]